MNTPTGLSDLGSPERYEAAIGRRNTTWSRFRDAEELLETARREGREPEPYVRNYNQALDDYERASDDLLRARVWFRRPLEEVA